MDIQAQAAEIAHSIRHYLITRVGRTEKEASDEEYYRAFAWALREKIMTNWVATSHTLRKKGVRRVYYISMEYLPGRQLINNITNIKQLDLVQEVLQNMGRDLSAVKELEPDMGIGNGGLGRLASCLMDSLATQKYPALGYGMRYEYGIFEQELFCGVQIERPDCWLLTENPWEFRRDNHATSVHFSGEMRERKNKSGAPIFDIVGGEDVRALPYDYPIIGYSETPDNSILTLRLWSTKSSPRNFGLQKYNAGRLDAASENTSLTDVLYPNDNHDVGKRIRLKQEFLLVSASLSDIFQQYIDTYGEDYSQFGDMVRIQINDTHPALAIAELMRQLLHRTEMGFDQALETTRAVCSYTNHTILKEALEEWNEERMQELLPRQFAMIKKLEEKLKQEIQAKFPDKPALLKTMSIFKDGQVRMANLSIFGSHKVNGVAALHTSILKNLVFNDFNELYPEKFVNVTNGVTQRRWLLGCNEELAKFLTQRIGSGWITNLPELSKIRDHIDDEKTIQEFLEIKKRNKEKLLTLLNSELDDHFCGDQCDLLKKEISTDALFDIQIKRIHEYKRQLMNALHVLILYNEMKEDTSHGRSKRCIIFGGKAAPGYRTAKNIIRLIYCIARKIAHDPEVNKQLQVFYIENYNVSKAELLIPAADLSEQISLAGLEASGTGNMKFAMNGALTIGTDDGANVEMREAVGDEYWPFLFGASSSENFEMKEQGNYSPEVVLKQHPHIERAVKMLADKSLAENDAEHEVLVELFDNLQIDRYHIMHDMPSYYEAQKKVEEIYKDKTAWAKLCLHNIAGMGRFSTDESIKNYASQIWGIEPTPIDPEQMKQVENSLR